MSILQYILKILSQIILWRYRPRVVGITGSVGKTGAKEAIYRVLRRHFKARRNIKNYNNELGVPLTILGSETGGNSVWRWLKIFLKASKTIIWEKNYPEILILEMGIDKPGDMKYLMSFVPVDVGVMTAIGEFPVHIEFFPEKGRLVEEKALLLKSLPAGGLAVLNYDDLSVRMVGDDLPEKVRVIQYGFGEGADLRIDNYQMRIGDLEKNDFGINFKIDYKGSAVPMRLPGVLGKQQASTAAAATSVGVFFGLNLVDISRAVKRYRALPGRTNLLKGIKNSYVLDDSYNASPLAVLAALDILEEVGDSRRKIVVLGDMLELGNNMEIAHRQIGARAAKVADLLFTVGDRARFIADEARQKGMPRENIFDFSDVQKAALAVQEKIAEGDIILVKGSQSMRMEGVVKEIMAEPEKADKLLVRQGRGWTNQVI
ncbi:UDP-N-acetylmuramoyl-tripeptide--D-alanyl-D-alanine ligase [Patescibacteria group bacterium]|nr:UDP-N-acetylmuramoyl-tripeptide--D-alanyl-D-alanine ligase [Patescibacteria group bacterium]MBU2579909.1 UDP-N-acetylmuramoyl-tripeptide--D-alanyl-D-alanine ligase [Patescibacteria group bacterium]